MPLKTIQVQATSVADLQTEDDKGVTVATVSASGSHLRFKNRMSWFAFLYRTIPDGVGIAGVKYAFNPHEARWRR